MHSTVMHAYDAAKLADLGYGDTGAATVEMDWQDVILLAKSVQPESGKTIYELCAEIESTRID